MQPTHHVHCLGGPSPSSQNDASTESLLCSSTSEPPLHTPHCSPRHSVLSQPELLGKELSLTPGHYWRMPPAVMDHPEHVSHLAVTSGGCPLSLPVTEGTSFALSPFHVAMRMWVASDVRDVIMNSLNGSLWIHDRNGDSSLGKTVASCQVSLRLVERCVCVCVCIYKCVTMCLSVCVRLCVVLCTCECILCAVYACLYIWLWIDEHANLFRSVCRCILERWLWICV